MSTSDVSEFVYRLPGKPGSSRPGAHRSNTRGPGIAFSNYARLLDHPDPRRLDLRASINNVNREWLIRSTRQFSATVVQVLVDVSASMRFGTPTNKLDVTADFIESLGYSAFRYGDALGMQAFDRTPIVNLSFPARTGRGVGGLMASALRSFKPSAISRRAAPDISAQTLLASALRVSPGSSLVFLVSDFHWPLDNLAQVLDQFNPITLVPIVVWHNSETQPPKVGRWLRTIDVETGKQHNLLTRASSVKRWQANVVSRRAALHQLFSAREITPFFMEDGFDAEELSRYFMETNL